MCSERISRDLMSCIPSNKGRDFKFSPIIRLVIPSDFEEAGSNFVSYFNENCLVDE